MIDPAKLCFWVPPGLSRYKQALFDRIADHIRKRGGIILKHDEKLLLRLPDTVVPIIGCTPALTPLIEEWRRSWRHFIYWDRGYVRRVNAANLPRGIAGGYYRWHRNAFQMREIRDVPSDRWDALDQPVHPWQTSGSHILIAAPSKTYARFHRAENWIAETIDAISRTGTKRQIVIRDKESKRTLQEDLAGAHALVTHGSNAAVEAAVLGYPVFVHPESAAALVGQTDLSKIEHPVYPDRTKWLHSLAYQQFTEAEFVDGTLWSLL